MYELTIVILTISGMYGLWLGYQLIKEYPRYREICREIKRIERMNGTTQRENR